ncbi:MAG: type II secretion system protein GspG [Planctomycetaceae bacterium]
MQIQRTMRQTAIYFAGVVTTIAAGFLAPVPLRVAATAICFLVWFSVCCLTGPRRDAMAAGIAAAVYILTILASWIWVGKLSHAGYRELRSAQYGLYQLREDIEQYRSENERLPESLNDVFGDEHREHRIARCPWEHPPDYRITDRSDETYELVILGRDGRPGGDGIDSDFVWRSDAPDAFNQFYDDMGRRRIPLWQYLFETDSTVALVFPLLVVALVTQHTLRHDDVLKTDGKHGVAASIGFVLVLTAVCTFLGLFHVAAVQSGH